MGKWLLFILKRTWKSRKCQDWVGILYQPWLLATHAMTFSFIHLQIHQSPRILTSQSLHFIWLSPLKFGEGQGQPSGGKASQHGSNSIRLGTGLPDMVPTSSPRLALLRTRHRELFGGESWKHTYLPVLWFWCKCMLQAVTAMLDTKGKMPVRVRGQ